VPSIDKLRPDMELREKVKGYVDGEIERSKKEEREEKEREGENIKVSLKYRLRRRPS
jgi:hypothetical protein